jgi:hypothetical protein
MMAKSIKEFNDIPVEDIIQLLYPPTHLNQSEQSNASDNIKLNKEKKIKLNMYKAYNVIPESFTLIDMLYIPCSINQEYITAFIDTGAETNIMNEKTAMLCGLHEIIDNTWTSTLVGIGTQTSIGRIHYVEIIIGYNIVSCGFTIVKDGPNVLIGLNTMLRHGCVLDLNKRKISIGQNEIFFLQKKEILRDGI